MADTSEAGADAPPPPESAVNSQILDAVEAINATLAGHAPAMTEAMAGLAALQASALGMFDAVARQQADATIQSAAVAAACARMVGGASPTGAHAGPLVAMAESQAQAAILILKGQGDAGRDALERIREAAQPSPAPSATKKPRGK